MPSVVEILVTAKNLTGPAFAEAKGSATAMESTMAKVSKTASLAGVAMVAFLGESVKMASKFDSEMTLLHTQAGVSAEKMDGLKKGVLSLAGKVAQDPDSLAESLFHVESNFESMGITSEKALHLTETAAKGATVGHANLVDVTNALTAAVASGIPGVENFDQAMGVLNATVGVGDMKMQDLAAAFGSGMVATVKGFGLNITDVGAALAVFGDNNIRGALAGTQLRMSVQALAKPVASGGEALAKLGLQTDTLAKDMQKGGLKLALEDLVARMEKAGISADQQGQIITQAFGRKAGAGLNVLVSQMDRLESKYPALEKGAQNFSQAWEDTTHTFAFQIKSLEEKLQSLMISLGEKLIPVIQKGIAFFEEHKRATLDLAQAAGVLLGAFVAFGAVTKVIALFKTLGTAVTAMGDAMAIAKLKMFELQVASAGAGSGLGALGAAFGALGTKAKLAVAATGIGLAILVISKLSEAGQKAAPDVDQMTTALTALGQAGEKSGELTKTFGVNLDGLGYAVERVAGKSTGMDHFNDIMNKIFTLGMGQSNSLKEATKEIGSLDDSLAGLVKSGHADIAAQAVKRMQEALAAQGKDPGKLTGELTKYNGALQDLDLMDKMSADSMGVFGSAAQDTTKLLAAQTLTAEGLKQAIQDLNDVERAALDGMAGFEAAIDAASKALAENGKALHYSNGELDLSTEKARTEEGALTALAAKTDAAALAALNNGESLDKVNAIYDRGKQKLIELAEKMGLNTQQANDLADAILHVPDKQVAVTVDTDAAKRRLADIDKELDTASGPREVRLLAEASQLYKVVGQAQDAVDGMHGKTIDIIVNTKGGQSRENGNAHGGIIGGAATGGARGGLTWVGEEGPELVRLPYGATVHSNPDSQRIATSAGGGGGPSTVQLEWVGGNAGDEFMSWLRKNIRVRGGDVQTVLGH
jgi:TP901 family phage tail tape measure protein